jgi:arylsulfatase A-like enzyme
MELSDLPVPDKIRGRSLLPLIRGKVKTWREAVFSEIDHSRSMYRELRRGTGRRVMVRTKKWKLVFFMDDRVVDKDGALYDMENDPWEQRNLYGQAKYADQVRKLEQLAEKWDKGEI